MGGRGQLWGAAFLRKSALLGSHPTPTRYGIPPHTLCTPTPHTHTGDSIYLVHAKLGGSEEEAVAARKALVAAAAAWQASSASPVAPLVNLACDLVMGTSAPEDAGEGSVGAQICASVEGVDARSVVLAHHGKSMMREMMWGPAQLHITKNCARPLVVLQAQTSPAPAAAAQ